MICSTESIVKQLYDNVNVEKGRGRLLLDKKLEQNKWAAIPYLILYDVRMPHPVKILYVILYDLSRSGVKAWPARETLATALNCSKTSVDRYITLLKKFQWLRVERVGFNKPNDYMLDWPNGCPNPKEESIKKSIDWSKPYRG